MASTIFSWLLVLLVAWPATVEPLTQAPPSNNKKETIKRGKNCFLTAACESCPSAEVKCYEYSQLQDLYNSIFTDVFCGIHGVVLFKSQIGKHPKLYPLRCEDGRCPDGSKCVNNPDDDKSYCCSQGPKGPQGPQGSQDPTRVTHTGSRAVNATLRSVKLLKSFRTTTAGTKRNNANKNKDTTISTTTVIASDTYPTTSTTDNYAIE